MDRRQLLRRLDLAWQDFRASYDGVTEAEMLEPRFEGGWSIRDLITHITIWEEEALKHLPLILADVPEPRYSTTHGGIEAFNAASIAARQHLSLAQVLSAAKETHARLVTFIGTSVPEEELRTETRLRRRLRLDTYAHYALHARAIRQQREEIEEASAAGATGSEESGR